MPQFTRRKFLAHGAGFGTILIGGDVLSGVSSRVSVGVVGLGVKGRNHLRVLSQLPGARVIAICDTDPRALQAGARLLSNHAEFFTDFRHLLDRTDIDLVAIASAPPERMRLIEIAAQAGKHVVVEQPSTLSLEQAARLHNLGARLPISVEHIPSDPGWNGEALLPWLSLDRPQRVEIQVLQDNYISDSAFDEFEIAARLLTAGLPTRAVAFTASGLPGCNLSTEIELGAMRMALHQSHQALPRDLERRVAISVESPWRSATVTIDSWCEQCESKQSRAAWSRALAAIANGNRDGWTASTKRTAVVSATVQMVAAALRRGEYIWRRAES